MSSTVKVVGTCLSMSQRTVVFNGIVGSGRYRSSYIQSQSCPNCHKQTTVLNQPFKYKSYIPGTSVFDPRCKYKNNVLQMWEPLGNKCKWNILSSDFLMNAERHLSTKQILESSPSRIQPYLRLLRFDKPIGTYLLFWPCSWSIALAAPAGHLPDLYMLGLFGLGSFVMRGAGCIINDMWDRDIDKKVVRTKMRPLASGELTLFQALVFLGGNLTVALTILLQLNWHSVVLGASSMILVILYPLAKCYTYWPQLVLGLTFNYGAMLGWCAVTGTLDWPIIPLYFGCILWTLVYDTIYAHQDKYDDMLIGVKSTALLFAAETKRVLTGFSVLITSCLSMTGYMCDQTWPYYTAVTITTMHLFQQLYTIDLNDPDDCLRKFKSNHQLGAIIFIGILLGTLLKGRHENNIKKHDKLDVLT